MASPGHRRLALSEQQLLGSLRFLTGIDRSTLSLQGVPPAARGMHVCRTSTRAKTNTNIRYTPCGFFSGCQLREGSPAHESRGATVGILHGRTSGFRTR